MAKYLRYSCIYEYWQQSLTLINMQCFLMELRWLDLSLINTKYSPHIRFTMSQMQWQTISEFIIQLYCCKAQSKSVISPACGWRGKNCYSVQAAEHVLINPACNVSLILQIYPKPIILFCPLLRLISAILDYLLWRLSMRRIRNLVLLYVQGDHHW